MYFTWELKPSVVIMKKNRVAQSGATGRLASPSGYTTNIKPGPVKYTHTHLGLSNVFYVIYCIIKFVPEHLFTNTSIVKNRFKFRKHKNYQGH